MFRIRNPESKYVIKPVNSLMTKESKAPVFLSRRVRLKTKKSAIVGVGMKNYKELVDSKQVCIVPNPNSQIAAFFGKIVLNHQEQPLRQCLFEYFCYTNHNPEREETVLRIVKNKRND